MVDKGKSGKDNTINWCEANGVEVTSKHTKHIQRLLREEDAQAATVDQERDRLVRINMYKQGI